MIVLDYRVTLRAVLVGAITTNQPDVQVQFFDEFPQLTENGTESFIKTRSTYKRTAMNGVTDVTICTAPNIASIRNVRTLTVYNRDTASATVIVKTNDGTTDFIFVRQLLLTLQSLHYDDSSGWQIL